MRLAKSSMLGLAVLTGFPASAQTISGTDPANSDYHTEPASDIVVTAALPVSRLDALSGVAVLQGSELTASLRSSIGETLAKTPGVSASSFGPNASRPILRGMQGERVRVLSNGIGSIDVSNTSADHATLVNPLLAERIEVLRGPQSLLYGSAAIGGVVNVIDRRIPATVPDEPVHLDAQLGYASAADERSAAASADVALGGGWVIHADGSYLKSNDLRIGGFALTPELRTVALASGPEFADNAAVRDRLPNTASRTWTAGMGAAWIGEKGSLGVAYSRTDSLYGVPLRFAVEPDQETEAPRLKLTQDRIDASAELNTSGSLIEQISLRLGYAEYQHSELEEDGSVGTTFFNQGLEGRLEVTQAQRGGWQGVIGAQFASRNFDVIGDEAFLPGNATRQFGIFTVQQIETGLWRIEAGARLEHTRLASQPLAGQLQFLDGTRKFTTFSASAGAAYAISQGWKLGVNLSRTARAPAAEELFANGPHAGTQAFELGDPDLRPERAWSVEAILRGGGEGYTLEASAYYNWFANYIYDDRTGDIEDGLPVFQLRQASARIYGFEIQGSATLAQFGEAQLSVDALADYVHAAIIDTGPAPRIPSLRFLGGASLTTPKFDLRGEVERVTIQNRVAAFETATPGYTLVNAEITWRPSGQDRPLSVILSANNLFNVTARRHASFLKDYAPLSGRDIRLTLRLEI